MKADSKALGRFVDIGLVVGCLLLFGLIAHRLWLRSAAKSAVPAVEATGMWEELPRVEFSTLEKVMPDENYHPVYSDSLRELNGETVRIQGFMVPYESELDMSTFMLFPFPTGCGHCAAPAINQVVLVRQEPSRRRRPYLEKPIEVSGRLNLWREDSKDPAHTGEMFLFILEEAQVREVTMTPDLLEKIHGRHLGL